MKEIEFDNRRVFYARFREENKHWMNSRAKLSNGGVSGLSSQIELPFNDIDLNCQSLQTFYSIVVSYSEKVNF